MIKGFRFTNQLANAEVDARIHQEFLNKNDGIFYGMELSYTNNSVTIAEGLCEIAGRPIAVIDSETVSASTESLYCLLVLEIDLSKDSTKDTFNQASFKLLTSSASYPTVTQQDINKYSGTDTIYQLEFARFKSGSTGISDFKDTRQFLDFAGIYTQIKSDCKSVIDQIKQELASVEDGSAYVLKNNIAILTGSMPIEGKSEGIEFVTTNTHIDFPEGFNRDNCVVLAFGTKGNINLGYTYGHLNSADSMSLAMFYGSGPKAVTLGGINTSENKIIVHGSNFSSDAITFYYKIVLLKIS